MIHRTVITLQTRIFGPITHLQQNKTTKRDIILYNFTISLTSVSNIEKSHNCLLEFIFEKFDLFLSKKKPFKIQSSNPQK